MRKLLAFLLLCAGSCFGTSPISGTLRDPGTGTVSSGAFIRVFVRGCSANQPRVNGVALIPPRGSSTYYVDFAPNSSGVISGTVYSTRDAAGTGNGEIQCGTSFTAVWLGIQPYFNGVAGVETPVHSKNGVSLDLTNATPITTTSVVTAPTGDTTYCRIDGGNCGFTGPISFSSAAGITSAGSNSFTGSSNTFTKFSTSQTPVVNVTAPAYGADPTGVADSAAAIRAAMAQSASTGVDLYFPAGTYLINSSLGNFGTNYSVVGEKSVFIKAGAAMTNMATFGGNAPPPYFLGWMRGIFWNCNSQATHAYNLGSTLDGYTWDGGNVYNCNGDGITTTAGAAYYLIHWINYAFCNNLGHGAHFQGNNGEEISFTNFVFCNNTQNGVMLENTGAGGSHFSFISGSFDSNLGWGAQFGTSADSATIVNMSGVHFEQPVKWLQNFQHTTCTGCFFTNGSASGTLGYLIDNEGSLSLLGGRITQSGSGVIFNPSPSGTPQLIALNVTSLPFQSVMKTFDDGFGDTTLGTVTVNNLTASAGITATGVIQTSSGFKPTGGGGQATISGDGTNVTTSKGMFAQNVLANQGSICTSGELALSAGWGSTASASLFGGTGQTCEWTITSAGTGQGANPTVTDTLTNPLPNANTLCEMRMVGGTGTTTLLDNTTFSATAPIFTFGGTPVAASTYKVMRRCGP